MAPWPHGPVLKPELFVYIKDHSQHLGGASCMPRRAAEVVDRISHPMEPTAAFNGSTPPPRSQGEGEGEGEGGKERNPLDVRRTGRAPGMQSLLVGFLAVCPDAMSRLDGPISFVLLFALLRWPFSIVVQLMCRALQCRLQRDVCACTERGREVCARA
jgi:hypothetical protein